MLHELALEYFPVVEGYVESPERPGLGVTIDEDFVARYRKA
jgi:L-alanine-DL-glutamate epimerase-like enolase superfamily enzyme